LGLLALISITVHSWLIARTEVPARDAIGFVRQAAHLESPPGDGTRLDVVRGSQHPPGYPAAVWGVSAAVRGATGEGITRYNMMLSAQLTAALAALLTVVPMYLLGRRLFGPNIAALAAGMFQILPVY